MARNTSSGITPEIVIELLKGAVAKKGQSAVARESGIALYSVQRYIKGIGYPTEASFQKLADYFGVSVWELRGDVRSNDINIDRIRLLHNLQSMLKGALEYKEEIPEWLADSFRDVAETISATQITGESAVADVTKEVKKTAEAVLKKIRKNGKR